MQQNWNWLNKDPKNSLNNLPMQALGVSPLSSFYRDIDSLFAQAFRNFGFGNSAPQNMFTPSVDISSTDKEYTIEVEVPGLTKDDIRIDLSRDGQLCICGEKRLENDKQEKDFHRIECSYGAFSRTLGLPEDVDAENIQADCTHGILTITAPRIESAASQGRRIEVQSSDSETPRSGRQHRNRQDNSRQDNAAQSSQGHRAA